MAKTKESKLLRKFREKEGAIQERLAKLQEQRQQQQQQGEALNQQVNQVATEMVQTQGELRLAQEVIGEEEKKAKSKK